MASPWGWGSPTGSSRLFRAQTILKLYFFLKYVGLAGLTTNQLEDGLPGPPTRPGPTLRAAGGSYLGARVVRDLPARRLHRRGLRALGRPGPRLQHLGHGRRGSGQEPGVRAAGRRGPESPPRGRAPPPAAQCGDPSPPAAARAGGTVTSRDPIPSPGSSRRGLPLLGAFRRGEAGGWPAGRWGSAFFGAPPALRPCFQCTGRQRCAPWEPEGLGVGEGPGSRLALFLVEPVRESLPRPHPHRERVLPTGLLLGGGEREPAPMGASSEGQEGVSSPGGRWARTGDPELGCDCWHSGGQRAPRVVWAGPSQRLVPYTKKVA